MPASTTYSNALTTAARVKSLLGITISDHDTILNYIIADCTKFIESYCQRTFKRATYTQELYNGSYTDGTPKSCLVLKNAPLVSISALQYRTGAKSSAVWVDYPSDNYQEELETAVINGTMPAGIQNIRVTYVAGYLIDFSAPYDATHTLPFDISGLCERLVMRRFKKRDSEGRSNDSFNGSQVTWDDFLEDADKMVLANYQRMQLS